MTGPARVIGDARLRQLRADGLGKLIGSPRQSSGARHNIQRMGDVAGVFHRKGLAHEEDDGFVGGQILGGIIGCEFLGRLSYSIRPAGALPS